MNWRTSRQARLLMDETIYYRCHPISFRSAWKLKAGNHSKPKLLWISKVKKGYPDLKEKDHDARERIQPAIFRLISPGHPNACTLASGSRSWELPLPRDRPEVLPLHFLSDYWETSLSYEVFILSGKLPTRKVLVCARSMRSPK